MAINTPMAPDLHAMALAHFNEPVLVSGELCRLIGYAEDDRDAYLIVQRGGHRPKTFWMTCVGGYTFLDRLKGQNHVKAHNGEDWDDFTRLDGELRCSGVPRVKEFHLVIRHEPSSTPRP